MSLEIPLSWLKPKNDFVFKLLFGSDNEQSRELLLAFLNDVLQVPEGQSLASVEILNPLLPKQDIPDKYSILDIKARVRGYGYINVEIQLTNQKNLHKRSLYYAAKLYEEQLVEGDNYTKLTKVVAINLIDFPFFTHEQYRSCFQLKEESTGQLYPDLMQLYFIELPKFVRQEEELAIKPYDRMAKWLRFLTNTDDARWERMAKQEPILDKAISMLRKASLDPEARLRYEEREKAIKDIASIHHDGLLEGREQGMKQGMEQGMEIVAMNMLKEGLSYSLITKMTGISAERLRDLHKELQENKEN